MNIKVLDSRKKLQELSKKYSVDVLKKYDVDNAFTSSSEDLSSSDEGESVTSLRKSQKNEDHSATELFEETRLSGSDTKVTDDLAPGNNVSVKRSIEALSIESEIKYDGVKDELKGHSSVSEISFVKSSNSREVLKEPHISSNLSSVKSDFGEDHSEIEEILTDEEFDSSSDVNLLANVHLVSDDLLEEVESNINSDSSDDGGRGTRLSVVHSVKSVQLNSPIEPPKLEPYDYESDFENSSTKSGSLQQKSKIMIDRTLDYDNKLEEPTPIKINEYLLNNVKSSDEHSESEYSVHSVNTVSDSEVGSKFSEPANPSHSENINYVLSKEVSIEDDLSSKFGGSISTSHSENLNYKLSKESLSVQDSSNDVATLSDYKKIASLNNNVETIAKQNLKGAQYKQVKSHKSKNNERRKEGNSEYDKIDVGINVNFPLNSVGVQTDLMENNNLHDKYTYDEETVHNFKKNRRKIYVNTSVKSTKFRPTVSAGDNLNCELNPLGISDTVYNPYSSFKQDFVKANYITPVHVKGKDGNFEFVCPPWNPFFGPLGRR